MYWFKVIEIRNEPHESKFETEFTVDICTEEGIDEFIYQFENKKCMEIEKENKDGNKGA